jgi:hypothetical protein
VIEAWPAVWCYVSGEGDSYGQTVIDDYLRGLRVDPETMPEAVRGRVRLVCVVGIGLIRWTAAVLSGGCSPPAGLVVDDDPYRLEADLANLLAVELGRLDDERQGRAVAA